MSENNNINPNITRDGNSWKVSVSDEDIAELQRISQDQQKRAYELQQIEQQLQQPEQLQQQQQQKPYSNNNNNTIKKTYNLMGMFGAGGNRTMPINDSLEERARKYERLVQERQHMKMYGGAANTTTANNTTNEKARIYLGQII